MQDIPVYVIDELKVHIDLMTTATDKHKYHCDMMEVLRDEYNAYSDEERMHNPNAWFIREKWQGQAAAKLYVRGRILLLTDRLLKLTGNEINLWPRHLKYQHPNGLDISMYDTPKARQAADGEEVCCVCMDNLPNAKFTGCCCFSGVCTVCASSLIRRLLECPQCGDMLFDFEV